MKTTGIKVKWNSKKKKGVSDVRTSKWKIPMLLSNLSVILDNGYHLGGRNSSLVVSGLAVHSITGSILLWGNPGRGHFSLGVNMGSNSIPPKNSFGWEYKPRSSLCTHAFHRSDSKDPDVHVLDGWMPATKTRPACTIHEDRMWLP